MMLPPKIRLSDRFELKYLLNRAQAETMIEELSRYMIRDERGDEFGRYLITSVYFDTADYQAYWDKVEGHRFRRKVRVRVYGREQVTPDTRCFAEIKQRINKTLQKKRVILPYAQAMALCGAGEAVKTEDEADQAVIDEILYLYHTLQLQPACVVSYQRLAFEGSGLEPGLRVTFDTQLKCRVHDLSLLSQGYADNQYFLPPQQSVLEVKVNQRTPYWLTELINKHRCAFRRISKYCLALEQAKLRLGQQQIVY
ncbi:MAG: vacuolar transporter [Anaerolineae bacterium]|nr:polyphosphate polymerase domain-containing protein [Anaerolineales bacterium]MCQ3973726.1 vacuolar transporter [Anaerolineae bacterium]